MKFFLDWASPAGLPESCSMAEGSVTRAKATV